MKAGREPAIEETVCKCRTGYRFCAHDSTTGLGLTFGHDLNLEHSINALENLVTNRRQPIIDETASKSQT